MVTCQDEIFIGNDSGELSRELERSFLSNVSAFKVISVSMAIKDSMYRWSPHERIEWKVNGPADLESWEGDDVISC